MARRKEKKYLNNFDLLKEINKSKISFCYVMDKSFIEYDYIVFDESEISEEIIDKALVSRIKRLNHNIIDEIHRDKKLSYKASREFALKNNLLISSTERDEVVIRVMTDEHIPLDISGEKVKTQFSPFKHYLIDSDGELIEIVRSHWIGDLENGHFSDTHGNLTNELCKMFIKLVDENSRKSNVRKYTYLEELKGEAVLQLTKSCLKFKEELFYLTENPVKQLNPFAYYTSFVNNAFASSLNAEKLQRNIRDSLLEFHGFEPSITRQIEIEESMINTRKGNTNDTNK